MLHIEYQSFFNLEGAGLFLNDKIWVAVHKTCIDVKKNIIHGKVVKHL
jgi:hypothetical protein